MELSGSADAAGAVTWGWGVSTLWPSPWPWLSTGAGLSTLSSGGTQGTTQKDPERTGYNAVSIETYQQLVDGAIPHSSRSAGLKRTTSLRTLYFVVYSSVVEITL